jgi:hypothetical protein
MSQAKGDLSLLQGIMVGCIQSLFAAFRGERLKVVSCGAMGDSLYGGLNKTLQ